MPPASHGGGGDVVTRLDGWAKSDRWKRLHFVREGVPLCGLYIESSRVRLVGSIKGRDTCAVCTAAHEDKSSTEVRSVPS